MNLRELQMEILAAIHVGTPSPVLQGSIVNGQGLDPKRCLEIHRQTWLGARMEVLKSAFPVCHQIVGPACFRRLSRDYALAIPSRHPNLHLFPENLAVWLEYWIEGRPEFADYAYLPDLARYEWARYRIQETGDNETFDFTAFERLPKIQKINIRFCLSRAASLVSSRFPVHELWLLHTKFAAQGTLEARRLPEQLLVYKSEEGAAIEELSENAAGVYRLLAQGSSLKKLQVTADTTGFALDAFIVRLIKLGCITGFKQASHEPEKTT